MGEKADPDGPAWLASGRIPALDGLRAVAILFVLLAHVQGTQGFPDFGPFEVLLRVGPLGVSVFFVLSGFLITTLLCRELERSGRVRLGAFYGRRALRILPAYVCLLAFVAALQAAGLATLSARDWLAAVTYTMNFHSEAAYEVTHLWSLSIEEHFYLLWPPIFAVLPRRSAIRVLLAILVVQPIIRWVVLIGFPEWTPMTGMWTFTRFDTIAAGTLLALLARDPHSRKRLDRVARYWPLALALLGLSMGIGAILPKWAAGVSPSVGAGTLALLVWAAARRAPRALENPVAVTVGIGSYSLYLWQQVFLNPHQHWWTAFPQNLVLAAVAAWVSYRLVERPFLQLKGRLHSAPERTTEESHGAGSPPTEVEETPKEQSASRLELPRSSPACS